MSYFSDILARRRAGQSPSEAARSAMAERLKTVRRVRSGGGRISSGRSRGPGISETQPEPTPFIIQSVKKTASQLAAERMRERIELARRYKQERVIGITQQQYFQKTHEAKQEISRQKSEFSTTLEDIDPQTMYTYEGKPVSGAVLKAKLEQKYLPQLEKAERESQLAWSQARDLPKDTKITKTKEGYEFKLRDTSLDWSKGEFKKIEKAPPVVSQVAEFGFGAVSSFGALIKPALDVTIGTEKSRRSHFVSPLDVVFEPIGWSPKGSKKLMA